MVNSNLYIDIYIITRVFKTRPETESNDFWITVQYGSTRSNKVQ